MSLLQEVKAALGEVVPVAGAPVPLGEGDFCRAFLVDDRWVVRVARHARAAAALAREVAVLPGLAPHLDLPIPRPFALRPTSGGLFLAAHALIPGEPLLPEACAALPPAQRAAAASGLLRFLSQLAGAPRQAVEAFDPRGYYAEQRPAIEARVFPLLSPQARAACLSALADAPPDARRGLVHNDLSPGHILFDPATGRLTGIIDFGDLAFAEPDLDLRFFYEDYGPAFTREVLSGEPPERLARARMFSLWDTLVWLLDHLGLDEDLAGAIRQLEAEAANR